MPKSVFTDAHAVVVDYLIDLRMKQNISQVELARRLGKTQQLISLVERRDRRLDLIEFIVWVRALGGDAESALLELVRSFPSDTSI